MSMSYIMTPDMRAILQRDIDEGILSEPGQSVVWMLLKAYEHHVRSLRAIEAIAEKCRLTHMADSASARQFWTLRDMARDALPKTEIA